MGCVNHSPIPKTQPQCMPYALARYRAGVLGAYVLFSLSLRYLSQFCLNWNFEIKKLAKKQLISDVYVYEISSHTNACAMNVIIWHLIKNKNT